MARVPRSVVALAGALAAGFFLRCHERNPPRPSEGDEAVRVEVAVATVRPMERSLAATGTLAAREESVLGAEVAGRVQRVAVDVGSRVRRGDLLVRIDPRNYELRERQSAAALAQARATVGLAPDEKEDEVDLESVSAVREARALLEEATRNRDRASDLSGSGILSRSERDAVEAAYAVAATRYDRALEEARTRLAAVAQRRAEHEIARKQLADTSVVAPYDGTVRERQGNMGEYVAAGAPLVTLVEADPLRLRLEVAERDASGVRVGQLVRVSVEGDDRPYEGRIARVSPSLDEDTRMLPVEADVPVSGTLRPGLFVRARIVVDEADEALSIPADALVTFAGIEKVLVVEDGKAREKNVTTGRREGDWIEIVTGLDPGRAVVRNPDGLRSGQAIGGPSVDGRPAAR